MLRIIIAFLISSLFSQNVENVFYDFSRHQGHTLKQGDFLWNEDWSSNGIFFDGTFSNFSSMYGPQIESNLFKSCLLYTSPSPRDATLSRMPSSA